VQGLLRHQYHHVPLNSNTNYVFAFANELYCAQVTEMKGANIDVRGELHRR
jgi:hypothetical protein